MSGNINLANYTNGSTPYFIGDGVKEAMDSLKNASHGLFCWFVNNQVKTNSDKC